MPTPRLLQRALVNAGNTGARDEAKAPGRAALAPGRAALAANSRPPRERPAVAMARAEAEAARAIEARTATDKTSGAPPRSDRRQVLHENAELCLSAASCLEAALPAAPAPADDAESRGGPGTSSSAVRADRRLALHARAERCLQGSLQSRALLREVEQMLYDAEREGDAAAAAVAARSPLVTGSATPRGAAAGVDRACEQRVDAEA